MLTEKALPVLNAVALPAATSHHTAMGSVSLVQLGLTPNRLSESASKQSNAVVARVSAVVNGKSGLPVMESREQEAARSLLDLAKLNCNNKQQAEKKVESSTTEQAVVPANCSDPSREMQRNSLTGDRTALMEHPARKRSSEATGQVRKSMESPSVEPPRKKSSCVRTPQVDTIEEENADQLPHASFTAAQSNSVASTVALSAPIDDLMQLSANNPAYPVRSSLLFESRPRSTSLEQSPHESELKVSELGNRSDSRRHERLSLPAGMVRDQPMDLRVVSTRARRLEILPGGIVSQPPQSFVRDPLTMQHTSIVGDLTTTLSSQFTGIPENSIENSMHCPSYEASSFDEGGQAVRSPPLLPPPPQQEHHPQLAQQEQQHLPQQGHHQLQEQLAQQPQMPLQQQQLATFSHGGGQANGCVIMPPLVVPKQEYIADECNSREMSQNTVQPIHNVQSSSLNSWTQGIPVSASMGGTISVPMSAGATAGVVIGGAEEGKCVCNICHKSFPKMSQLRMHVNIHYFERPFRCDACAKSFRTRGHLQKHKRSVSHYNRVNMNLTFGTPTADNPRPFKCDDCKIAFRIHGHLAKHLRSKAHIMKLECLGKLPFGMYAELERSGVNLSDIDTTDCENSLESLQVLAQRLYQQEPCSLRWKEAGGSTDLGSEPEDDGIEAPLPPMQQALGILAPELGINNPSLASMQQDPRQTIDPHPPLPATSVSTNTQFLMPAVMQQQSDAKPDYSQEQQQQQQHQQQQMRTPQQQLPSLAQQQQVIVQQQSQMQQQTVLTPHVVPHGPLLAPQQQLQMPPQLIQDMPRSSCTCHLCGKVSKSAKSLQVHLHTEHADALHGSAFNAYLQNEAISLENNNHQ